MTNEKTDGLWLMMHPNQWTANTEINFGGGLYGKRWTGTITASANTRYKMDLTSYAIQSIVACGGSWYVMTNDNAKACLNGGTIDGTSGEYSVKSSLFRTGTGVLRFDSLSNQARSNMGYDIWVLYTK